VAGDRLNRCATAIKGAIRGETNKNA
jgi:hypothetical protein